MKYIFLFILLLPGLAHAFETEAKQAILLDTQSGTVLFAKQEDAQMVPSSMSKLMTLYALFREIKAGKVTLEDSYLVSEKAWRKGGSKMFVEVNKRVSVEDLIRGIAVQSGNDACIVVAEGISGSEESFASHLNRLGKEIGLKDSHFVNATGWPDEGHVMSPRDLATLTQRIQQDFPEFMGYFAESEFTFSKIRQPNRNPLLGSDLGVTGMKTGHTDAGGYGIVLSAVQDGREIVAVINGLESEAARKKEGERILRHGLNDFAAYRMFKAGEIIDEISVIDGKPSRVNITPLEDVRLIIEKGSEASLRSDVILLDESFTAPLPQGTIAGMLHITQDGEKRAEIPLAITQEVPRAGFFKRKIDAFKRWRAAK